MKYINYCLFVLFILFVNIKVARGQTITIEAESFSYQTNGVQIENGRSIGYFGASGTSVTYSVNIPSTGDYEVTFSYLSGGDGDVLVTANGINDKAVHFTKNATVNPNWWETPFTSWSICPKSTIALQAGQQNITLKATNIGVNIDWIKLTPVIPCTDNVVSSIKITASKTSCKVGEQIVFTAVGKSSCKDISLANVQWSANAPNGVFVGQSEGSVVISASATINGKTFTDQTTINVTNIVIDCTSPVAFYGKMIAVGNKIHGSKTNEPMQVKGASFFWSQWSGQYWNTSTVDFMVDNMKVELLRCAWGVDDNGNACEGDLNKLYTVVDQCIKRGIYVIIDWHAHTMDKNPNAAKGFFNTVAQKYGKYDNVIFELFNEPRQDASLAWPQIKSAQEQVLPSIRQYSDNLCIIGTPWFSQDVDIATSNPINDSNVAYAIHWYVANHCAGVWNKIPVAMANNKPLFGSEWGFWAKEYWSQCADQNFDQNVVAEIWMQKMDENLISWASWAIADKTSEQSSLFTGGYNLSNSGNWLKSNLDAWSKSPNNKWRQCTVCTDYTVSKLTLTAPKTVVALGASLTLVLKGASSCRENLAVPNPQWSTNAPNGIFTATSLGTHRVTVTANGLTKFIDITVVTDANSNIYKPVNGVLTALETEWYSYSNATSTVTKPIAITDGVKIDYAITQGVNPWDNTAGFGFNMVNLKTDKPYDLTGSTAIRFKYKGPAFKIAAKLNAVDANKDYCYHTTVALDASPNSYTEYTVTWSNFLQPSWGKSVPFDLKDINGFQFTYEGKTGDKGLMSISEVTILDVVLIDTPTLIKEEKGMNLIIYPNPSSGILNIESDQEYALQVIDIAGRVIAEDVINQGVSMIDLSGNKGICLLKFSNSSSAFVKKVVVK